MNLHKLIASARLNLTLSSIQSAGVAQLVERGAVNPVVGGSNPPPGAILHQDDEARKG